MIPERDGALTPAGSGSPRAAADLVRRGVLDTELAALLGLLAERGVPLVVASRSAPLAAMVRAALTEAPGGSLLAGSLEEVLRLSGAAPGSVPDELREIGVVVIVGEVERQPRVLAAHYVRRLERDAGGHVQRRPPAVLAAWNERDGVLEHFWWGITHELAEHAAMALADFQRERRARAVGLDEAVRADRSGAD